MAWTALLIAGVLEVVWAFTMKHSDGFTRFAPTLITLIALVASLALLSIAMRELPLGTAYTIWTGIGAIGAFLVGVFVLGEPASLPRLTAALLIIAGILLMKLAPDA